MPKLRILLLALLAIFVASAVATTVAQAELNTPELLVDKEKSLKFSTASGEAVLTSLSGAKIKCASSIGNGNISATSTLLGTLEVKFKTCSLEGFPCQTGATEGEIVAPLDFHLVFDTKPESPGTKLGAGVILKLLKQIHINCPLFFGVLVLVRGAVLGLLKPTNTLVKELTLELKQAGGENEEHTYWLLEAQGKFEEITKLPEPLESLPSTGTLFETAGEEVTGGTIKAEKGTEVLLMA